MEKGTITKGVPPMLLMPAENYLFKVSKEQYVIDIPRKGAYNELAPEIFDEEDGSFDILDEESKILYIPSITKVLFAVSKYPDLKFNQFFVPYSLKFTEDRVIITGQVIEMLVHTKTKESTDA